MPTQAGKTTTLPNQATFKNQTNDLLEFSARTNAKATMLFIAFDSMISDISTQQNNLILDAISKRLLAKARESDIYAHLGSMNFANLSINTSDKHAEILVAKLKDYLAQDIELSDGSSIKLNAKIGVAHYPQDADNYQSLINFAEQKA